MIIICCSTESFFNGIDLISIIEILVNSILAIWIVRVLQDKLTNKRYLKDHLIEEIKEVRNEYREFSDSLNKSTVLPKDVLPWFKLMNIKVNDVMKIIESEYQIDKNYIKVYQTKLRKIVTEIDEFNENFEKNETFKLNEKAKKILTKFEQKNNSKFNNLIVEINNSK